MTPVRYISAPLGLLALAASALHAGEAGEVAIPVPSGQHVEWMETIWDQPGPAGLAVRFRFLAPAIARESGGIAPDLIAQDMQHLCDHYALPRIADTGPRPAQIIISLSSAPAEFAVADPAVTQFFEAYSPAGGTCQWEAF